MSERGVFAVDRGIWDHDVLADRAPFSKREAWLWLISEAAWRPHRRRLAGHVIELVRGQLTHSLRFIGSKWHWSEARVRRFLDALSSEGMIVVTTDAGVTVITICKYDDYQRVSLPSDAALDTRLQDDTTHERRSSDAAPTHERRKVEDKEYKEKNAANAAPQFPALDPEVEYFRRARQLFGDKDGGWLGAKLLKAKDGKVPLARAALEQASLKDKPREYVMRIVSGPRVAVAADGTPFPDGII